MGTSDYTVYHSETVISQSQEGSIFIFRFTAHMAEQGIPSWDLIHHQFVGPIFGRVTDES